MTNRITGKAGEVTVDGKPIAKADWALDLNRDYVDARVFGEMNKTYLTGLRDVEGTFSGIMGDNELLLVTEGKHQVTLWLPRPQPWRTLYRWIGKGEDYPFVTGSATVEWDADTKTAEGKFGWSDDIVVSSWSTPVERIKWWLRKKLG